MTEKRAESIMIPEEANYQRTMKCDVEPYLRSYEKDGYIESYDKTAIYYRTYRIPLKNEESYSVIPWVEPLECGISKSFH